MLSKLAARLSNSLKVSKGQPTTADVSVSLAESQFLASCVTINLLQDLQSRVPEDAPYYDRLGARIDAEVKLWRDRYELLESTTGVNSMAHKFLAAEAALKSE